MGEKTPEKKSPSPLETKPVDRQVPEKTAKKLGGMALKGNSKK
jgi:hypothetical protein